MGERMERRIASVHKTGEARRTLCKQGSRVTTTLLFEPCQSAFSLPLLTDLVIVAGAALWRVYLLEDGSVLQCSRNVNTGAIW